MKYPTGTVLQRRTGYVHVKTGSGQWIPRSRWMLLSRGIELTQSHRVYHMDGDRTNDHPKNLAPIKFNATRYELLPSSKVIEILKLKGAKK